MSFTERHDIPVYHPDVRVWEVARGGEAIGLFYGDYFARPEKQGGAWMSSLRDQETLDGDVLPLIVNNCNFVKSDPALLSFDDARTLFHEFGHALHGLLSQGALPRLSGTNVARDIVELPSQLYEHWLEETQVLERFARHYQTGEPCRGRCWKNCWRRAISARALPRWNSSPRPLWTWTFMLWKMAMPCNEAA